MQRKRDGLVPIGEAISGLGGPVKAIREASPQALHHFTQADQVNQLVGASEADPDLGFMARLLALCALPRTNPGNRLLYKRVNGPYRLYMQAGPENKLPFGNLPRLLLAWVCTEAVRTRKCELVLGASLSEFMRKLDIYGTAWPDLNYAVLRGCLELRPSTPVIAPFGSSSTRKLDRPGSHLTAPRVAGVSKGVSAPPKAAAGASCGVLRDSRREVYPQTTVIWGSFPR